LHGLPLGAQRLLHGGYLAVGTFCVLSGFVTSLSYRHSAPWTRWNLLRYGVARVGRIYPAYLVSLLIVLPWILNYSQPNKAALSSRDVWPRSAVWRLYVNMSNRSSKEEALTCLYHDRKLTFASANAGTLQKSNEFLISS
jgi:peptidoglycan/LPS O-acetylase OafA/YrhL